MVQLADSDIKTREVLDWKGMHLLHAAMSSCSQKVRIALNLKGTDWTSRPINMLAEDNFKPWFLGINPRGLLPVLVHDGNVHIESNDILEYLDEVFPQNKLIPEDGWDAIHSLLKAEDDLHLDLRTLTMRFIAPAGKFAAKKPASLKTLDEFGGTVDGVVDERKVVEIEFWQNIEKFGGITDEQIAVSAQKFKASYDEFEERLQKSSFLYGDSLTVLDIAWFIYTHRLTLCQYPFERLHPAVFNWYSRLSKRQEFRTEVREPRALIVVNRIYRFVLNIRGRNLEKIAGI